MKQKGIKTILMLLCVCPFLQAQHTRSDNLTYFYDISLDGGVYIPTGDKRLSSGSSVSLSGSCYLTDKIGFRTGITRITELDGSDEYLKAPFLLAFRTERFSVNWFANTPPTQPESVGEFFVRSILYLIPTHFEFTAGPSFGYMTPSSESSSSCIRLNRRFASSLDANIRMSYQIWRFCLNGNMGINYLWTKNYTLLPSITGEPSKKPVWFAHLNFGCSFRF